MEPCAVIREIERQAGYAFDPDVVAALMRRADSGPREVLLESVAL